MSKRFLSILVIMLTVFYVTCTLYLSGLEIEVPLKAKIHSVSAAVKSIDIYSLLKISKQNSSEKGNNEDLAVFSNNKMKEKFYLPEYDKEVILKVAAELSPIDKAKVFDHVNSEYLDDIFQAVNIIKVRLDKKSFDEVKPLWKELNTKISK